MSLNLGARLLQLRPSTTKINFKNVKRKKERNEDTHILGTLRILTQEVSDPKETASVRLICTRTWDTAQLVEGRVENKLSEYLQKETRGTRALGAGLRRKKPSAETVQGPGEDTALPGNQG